MWCIFHLIQSMHTLQNDAYIFQFIISFCTTKIPNIVSIIAASLSFMRSSRFSDAQGFDDALSPDINGVSQSQSHQENVYCQIL